MNVLIVEQERLLFFIYDPHLVNQIFSRCLFILLLHQAGHSLICFEQLSLILVDNLLVLFSLSLKLKVVGIDVFLEIKVLLKELVPSS